MKTKMQEVATIGVIIIGLLLMGLWLMLPAKSPPVDPGVWWADASSEGAVWTDDDWEMAIQLVDSWEGYGWAVLYSMSDRMDARRWEEHQEFFNNLWLHSDEYTRAAAVLLIAQQGGSYDQFRQDPSKMVQDTIYRWDTGELPPGYDW